MVVNILILFSKKKKKLILSIIAASQNNFRTNYHILFSAFTGIKVLVARVNICVSSDGNGVDHHNSKVNPHTLNRRNRSNSQCLLGH